MVSKNERAILKRIKNARIRAMCGVKLIKKSSGQKLVSRLGVEKTLYRTAKAIGERWCGHVLRDNDDVRVKTKPLHFEVVERSGRG